MSDRRSIEFTAVIQSPGDQLQKLKWNLDQYAETLRRAPDDRFAIASAAIDYAVTAISLRDWILSSGAVLKTKTELSGDIDDQDVMDAIAKTAKHGSPERRFNGGIFLAIAQTKADEELKRKIAPSMGVFGIPELFAIKGPGRIWHVVVEKGSEEVPFHVVAAKNFAAWKALMAEVGLLN